MKAVAATTRIKASQNSSIRRHDASRALCQSSGEVQIWTEASVTGKGSFTRAQGVGLGIKRLGRECRHCAGSHRWHCVHAKEQGREMAPASYFVSKGVSYECCLPGACSEMNN